MFQLSNSYEKICSSIAKKILCFSMINPCVSIITPNYNDGAYLKKRLEELLPQFPIDWEYLIWDDGSTDNSVDLILPLTKKYPQCKLYQGSKNRGIMFSCNALLEKAKGKYVYGSSANDSIHPDFLDKMAKAARGVDAGVLTSIPGWTNQRIANKDKQKPFLEGIHTETFFPSEQVIRLFFKTHFWIAGHASLINRELAIKHGGFHKELKSESDWFLNHILALEKGAYYIPEVLASFHVDESSYGNSFSKKQRKKIYLALLHRIHQLPNSLRKKVQKSGILGFRLKPLFLAIILRPKYYDYLLYVILRKLRNKIKRCF